MTLFAYKCFMDNNAFNALCQEVSNAMWYVILQWKDMCIMYGNSIKVLLLKIRITNIQKEIYRKSPKVLFHIKWLQSQKRPKILRKLVAWGIWWREVSYKVAAMSKETKISCLEHLMKWSVLKLSRIFLLAWDGGLAEMAGYPLRLEGFPKWVDLGHSCVTMQHQIKLTV